MVVVIRLRMVVMTRLRLVVIRLSLVVMIRLSLVVMIRLRLVVMIVIMPYRVINIYYSVMCYNNHINSTRIQSIASMALMVFPDVPCNCCLYTNRTCIKIKYIIIPIYYMNNYTTTILVWRQSLGWAGAGGQGW